jgi:hypothetical protein
MVTAMMTIALVFIVTSSINAPSSIATSEKGRQTGGFYTQHLEM